MDIYLACFTNDIIQFHLLVGKGAATSLQKGGEAEP